MSNRIGCFLGGSITVVLFEICFVCSVEVSVVSGIKLQSPHIKARSLTFMQCLAWCQCKDLKRKRQNCSSGKEKGF